MCMCVDVCVYARARWGYCVWLDRRKQSVVVAFGQWDSEQFLLFSLAERLIIVDLLSSERNKKVIFALEKKEGNEGQCPWLWNPEYETGGCVGTSEAPLPSVPVQALLVLTWVPNRFDLWILHGYDIVTAFSQERMQGIQKTNLPSLCSIVSLNNLPDIPRLSFLLCKMGLIIPVFSRHKVALAHL